MKARTKQIILCTIAAAALLVITIASIPVIMYILRPEFQTELSEFVKRTGIWGMITLLNVQMLQIVIAFIPGEPIELVAGAMYGTLGGLIICLIGIFISSAALFYIVRRLGREKISKTKIYPKIMKYKFLQTEENLLMIVFLLYLIPGTPKDMLVYICALTPISMRSFLAIATFARIPSVITSTMAGAAFSDGNFLLMIIIFVITGIMGMLGIAYNKKRFKTK